MTRHPKTDPPEQLSEAERRRIVKWTKRVCPGQFTTGGLRMEWEKCRAWHEAHAVQRRSWEATFRSWLLKALEIRGERRLEKPQERGPREENVVRIGDYLGRLAGGKSWRK